MLDVISLPLGAVCFLLAFPVVLLGSSIATQVADALGSPTAEVAHDTLAEMAANRDSPWTWLAVATVVLVVPVFEEVLYRGLIQSGVRRVVPSAWLAVFITSAGFAAMHFSLIGSQGAATAAVAFVTLFLLSVCLGAAFERTRRIGVPIVMHGLFNAAMIAMVFLNR